MVKLRTCDDACIQAMEDEEPQHEPQEAERQTLAAVPEAPPSPDDDVVSLASDEADMAAVVDERKKQRPAAPRGKKPVVGFSRKTKATTKEAPEQPLEEVLKGLKLGRPEAERLAAKQVASTGLKKSRSVGGSRLKARDAKPKAEPEVDVPKPKQKPMQMSQDSVYSTRENNRPGRKYSETTRAIKSRVRRSSDAFGEQLPGKRVRAKV
jgi:hypothetical protein